MSRIFLLVVSIACLTLCVPIWLLGLGMSGGHWAVPLLGLPIIGLPIAGIIVVVRDRRIQAAERS